MPSDLVKQCYLYQHDDVIKWKHFPRYWPFVRGIHRSPVNSPRKEQWGRALMFSLICSLMKGLVNNREGGDLRRHRAHCDVTVMNYRSSPTFHMCHCNTRFVTSDGKASNRLVIKMQGFKNDIINQWSAKLSMKFNIICAKSTIKSSVTKWPIADIRI